MNRYFTAYPGYGLTLLKKLRAAFRNTLEDPEVSGNLRKVGAEDGGGLTPTQMADQMQEDLLKYRVR